MEKESNSKWIIFSILAIVAFLAFLFLGGKGFLDSLQWVLSLTVLSLVLHSLLRPAVEDEGKRSALVTFVFIIAGAIIYFNWTSAPANGKESTLQPVDVEQPDLKAQQGIDALNTDINHCIRLKDVECLYKLFEKYEVPDNATVTRWADMRAINEGVFIDYLRSVMLGTVSGVNEIIIFRIDRGSGQNIDFQISTI